LLGIGAILWQLGPYVAMEIPLPGGTLMALLLWLYRRSVHMPPRSLHPHRQPTPEANGHQSDAMLDLYDHEAAIVEFAWLGEA
jgi:hypothetical protein